LMTEAPNFANPASLAELGIEVVKKVKDQPSENE